MVTGGRNSNATPAQSPNVVCYTVATLDQQQTKHSLWDYLTF